MSFCLLYLLFLSYSLSTLQAMSTNSTTGELIVLVAPTATDDYYFPVAAEVQDFQVGFAEAIAAAGDTFLIFADAIVAPKYRSALSDGALARGRVVTEGLREPWARDLSPANPEKPVLFRYTAAGQGGGPGSQRHADSLQREFKQFLRRAGVPFIESKLLNDGGNLVDDGAGRAVISRKFLRDNKLSEAVARQKLQELGGLKHVAFIETDDPGGLEHSDGTVAFLEPNLLIVNEYENKTYESALHRDLKAGLPGVRIHTIANAFDDSRVFDERFGTICGLYANALVTPQRVYLPQYGLPEDSVVLEKVRSLTRKTVVPVMSKQVCHLGGAARCMAYQVRGTGAERLKSYEPPALPACFPAISTVVVRGRGRVRMDQLRVGDDVLVAPERYSRVHAFTHSDAFAITKFVVIHVATGANITLSPGHYIRVKDEGVIPARQIRIGHVIQLVTGEDDVVLGLSSKHLVGLYNPQTLTGEIAVDGIVATCYTEMVTPRFAHALLAPVRAVFSAAMSCSSSMR